MIPRNPYAVLCRLGRLQIGSISSRHCYLSLHSPASSQDTTKYHRPLSRSPTLLSLTARIPSSRSYASPTAADDQVDTLTELYGTARDEFEIAAEETEKKTVYAADDREAASTALKELQDAYSKAIKESSPEIGKEIQSRVGQRIRELETALKNLAESAMED